MKERKKERKRKTTVIKRTAATLELVLEGREERRIDGQRMSGGVGVAGASLHQQLAGLQFVYSRNNIKLDKIEKRAKSRTNT